MAKVPFVYYLHDNNDALEAVDDIYAQIAEDVDFTKDYLDEVLWRPFYEVKLKCELDTETFEVTILGAATT